MPPDRIAVALRDLATTLPEGARLPSVRELMREHGASPVTVQRAIAGLAAEGLVTPRPGRGTFVAAPPRARRAAGPGLAGGRARRPRGRDRRADGAARAAARGLARAQLRLPRPGAPADGGARRLAGPRRPPARARGSAPAIEGVGALRAWFAARRRRALRRPRHRDLPRRAGRARDRRARACRRPAGPCSSSRRPTAGRWPASAPPGLTPLPVPERRRRHPPRAAGRGAGADRRARRLPAAAARQPARRGPRRRRAAPRCSRSPRRAGAFLVEDDWARDLTIDGPAPAPLAADDADGHVVYVRSLSKAASPGLRVAASRRAGRPAPGCARPASSRTCSSARRSSTPRSTSCPHRAGGGT